MAFFELSAILLKEFSLCFPGGSLVYLGMTIDMKYGE